MFELKQRAAVIDIGSSKVVCLICEENGLGGFSILGQGMAQYAGFRSGQWLGGKIEDGIYSAIRKAELVSGKRVREVYVGVPGMFTDISLARSAVPVRGRTVTEQDVTALFREAEQTLDREGMTRLHTCSAGFIADDAQFFDPVGQIAQSLSGVFSVVYADAEFLKMQRAIFNKLNIKVKRFISSLLAQCLCVIPSQCRDAVSVLVDSGYYCTDVCVVKGDAIVAFDCLSFGGFDIAQDISKRLGIPLSYAEQLKKRYVFGLDTSDTSSYDIVKREDGSAQRFPHPMVESIIETTVSAFLTAVKGVIARCGVELGEQSRVYLTGGAISMNRGIREFASREFGTLVFTGPTSSLQTDYPLYGAANALMEFLATTL